MLHRRLPTIPVPRSAMLPAGVGLMLLAMASPSAKAGPLAAPQWNVVQLRSGAEPYGITLGPDGRIWFTEQLAGRVGAVNGDATVVEYLLPRANAEPDGITSGPDGNVWVAEFLANAVARVTPAGSVTEFPLPTPEGSPEDIAAGSDGNLWFTEFNGDKIGRITPQGQITEFRLPAFAGPFGITGGPDGNVWFTTVGSIGRITPGGRVTLFPMPPQVGGAGRDITAGQDGNLWFTDGSSQVAYVTTWGTFGVFQLARGNSVGITTGSDGYLWFTVTNVTPARVAQVSGGGLAGSVRVPPSIRGQGYIASGSDGSLWFTDGPDDQLINLVLNG